MLQDICRLVWKVVSEYWCLGNVIEICSSPWQQFLVQVQHKQWASRIVEGGLGWTAMLRWCQLLHVQLFKLNGLWLSSPWYYGSMVTL